MSIAITQPSVPELYAYYKAKPKKTHGATARDCFRCLIAQPLRDQLDDENEEALSVEPFWGEIVIHDGDEIIDLDPALKKLANDFDRYGLRKKDYRHVSAGACARIIERFAKKEGIALG